MAGLGALRGDGWQSAGGEPGPPRHGRHAGLKRAGRGWDLADTLRVRTAKDAVPRREVHHTGMKTGTLQHGPRAYQAGVPHPALVQEYADEGKSDYE